MRTTIPPQFPLPPDQTPQTSFVSPLSVQWTLFAVLLFAAQLLAAQAPAANPVANSTAKTHVPVGSRALRHKSARVRKDSSAARSKAAQPETASTKPSVQAAPPAPEAPHWPVKQDPIPAAVTWDSQGLRIVASNSSLQQILKDVAAATGASIEGLGDDQRVFGAFGPGPTREVISQLMQGSGYDFIMIGDQGQGTPRQIVFSSRNAAKSSPAATLNQPAVKDDDADAEAEGGDQPPQHEQDQPVKPGFTPGPPR